MKAYLEAIGLALFTVFAPIRAILIVVFALVFCDFVTGVLAARKNKDPITSSGFKRTVGKLLMYEIALCVAFLVHQYLTGDLLPADKLVASMIGLVELKSVLENLDIISGQSLFKTILAHITQAQDSPPPPPPSGAA